MTAPLFSIFCLDATRNAENQVVTGDNRDSICPHLFNSPRASLFDDCVYAILFLTLSHQFSVGFRSGQLPDHVDPIPKILNDFWPVAPSTILCTDDFLYAVRFSCSSSIHLAPFIVVPRFGHDVPNHLVWWVLHRVNCIIVIKSHQKSANVYFMHNELLQRRFIWKHNIAPAIQVSCCLENARRLYFIAEVSFG